MTTPEMEEHNRYITILAEEYIGKDCMDRLNQTKDTWTKKSLYLSHIKGLYEQAGRFQAYMRRCKKADSETYKRYEKAEQEIKLLADNLALDLMVL